MRIKPTVASVVGPVTQTHWGQILMLPCAYGVVEIQNPAGGALTQGIQILSKLTHYLSEQPTSLAKVEAIAQEVTQEHMSSLILLVPVGAVVYMVLRGKGAVYLKRGNQLSVLVEDAGGALSGEVQIGDTLLLATGVLTDILPKDELTTIFDHLKPAEVAEKLTLLLHEKANGAGAGALIFRVEDMVALEEEPLPQEEVGKVAAIAQPGTDRHLVGPNIFSRRFLAKAKAFRPHHLAKIKPPTRTAVIAAGLIFFFGISVVFGLIKQAGNTKAQAVIQAVAQAQRMFDEGTALSALNPVKGREQLEETKAMLEPFMKTTSPRSSEGKKLTSLYQQVADAIIQSLAITKGEPQLFYDVSLLKKGAIVSSMALSGDILALVDTAGRTVYIVSPSTKNGQMVAGGEGFEAATLVGTTSENAYVLVSGGIHKVSIKTKTTKQLVIKKDDQWGLIHDLVTFGGNIYLADSTKSRIWKYIATEEGFTDRREYLNPDTLPDLSRVTSMAIDGSVWVGTSTGKILRFTQGKENTFLPQGVEPSFGSTLSVFTSDEVKNVYILDKEKKRVVVLDKDGMYLAQYVWEGDFTSSQIVVSEEIKKILFLADGKIYSLDLK